jgi:hypothetical protein
MQIIDNLIPIELLNECILTAEQNKSYGILHGAGDGSYCFKYNWTFFDKNLNINENTVLIKLWDIVKEKLPQDSILHKAYVNAHTYGVEDSIHVDDPFDVLGNTVIVYLCANWYPEWFGQTLFFKSVDKHNNEIIHSVVPKYNRFIVFDKDLPHCVSPLSRKFTGVRLTCMFKTEFFNANLKENK